MDSRLVVPVHVLIDTVLLHDEDLAADPQEFVQFVDGQLVETLGMQDETH